MPLALVWALGCVMAEFVRFTLDDGSEVLFESAESDLVRCMAVCQRCAMAAG
jgi:hypothetical protein